MASGSANDSNSQFSVEAIKQAFNGIKNYIESGKGKKLTLMVVGEAGQGKSSLANTLVPGAIVGDNLQAGTTRVQKFNTVINEVEIEVWDTPGFGLEDDSLSDDDIVEQMRGCSDVDLVLFCLRMDLARIPTRVHNETIRRMTKLFGIEFWKRVAFVLTFAKGAAQLCPSGEDLEEFFADRCEKVRASLQEAVRKHTSISLEDTSKIPVIPVDCCPNALGGDTLILPDGKNWFDEFWLTCTNHLGSKDLAPKLIQANRGRIVLEMALIDGNDVDLLDEAIDAYMNRPEEEAAPPIHLTSELNESDDVQESKSKLSNLSVDDMPDLIPDPTTVNIYQTQPPATTNNPRRRRPTTDEPSQNAVIRHRPQQPEIPLAATLCGNENFIVEAGPSLFETIQQSIMKIVYDIIDWFKASFKSVLSWS